jgi:hypothetical protein
MDSSQFSHWESFYVIVGSSAGALTGLQFVVIALIADVQPKTSSVQISAFGTPTIVHFCTVLMLSAVLSAPWPGLVVPATLFALSGAIGIGYVGVITTRARRQKGYTPVFEDWVFHTILPFVSYSLLFVGGLLLSLSTNPALFMIATTSLMLLFVGIHNAWDTVTFIVINRNNLRDLLEEDPEQAEKAEENPE